MQGVFLSVGSGPLANSRAAARGQPVGDVLIHSQGGDGALEPNHPEPHETWM